MLRIFHADVQSSSRWVFETLGPNWTKTGNTYFLFFQSFETYSQYWLAEHKKTALYLKGTDVEPLPVPSSSTPCYPKVQAKTQKAVESSDQ